MKLIVSFCILILFMTLPGYTQNVTTNKKDTTKTTANSGQTLNEEELTEEDYLRNMKPIEMGSPDTTKYKNVKQLKGAELRDYKSRMKKYMSLKKKLQKLNKKNEMSKDDYSFQRSVERNPNLQLGKKETSRYTSIKKKREKYNQQVEKIQKEMFLLRQQKKTLKMMNDTKKRSEKRRKQEKGSFFYRLFHKK